MIQLRALNVKDAQRMLEWMHDKKTRECFQQPLQDKTLEDVLCFIKNAKTQLSTGNDVHFAVTDKSGEYLGTVSMKNYNARDKNAEFAICLHMNARGKGIGTMALKCMLQIAFEKWGLERVYLNVLKCNKQAIRIYESCGFRFEGIFVKHLYIHGKYQDLLWYGLLREDYLRFRSGDI